MRRRPTVRVLAAPGAVLLAAVLVAGCGGGGDEPGVASVSQSQSQTQSEGGQGGQGGTGDKSEVEQAQAFVDCLREQGLEVEDPDPATGELNLDGLAEAETDRDALFQALQKCGDKAPPSFQDQTGQAPDPAQQKQFAQCMRDNGVDMDDPGPQGLEPSAMPTDDPDFDTALDACRDQLTGEDG